MIRRARSLLFAAMMAFMWGVAALAQPNIILILADDFSMNLMPAKGDGISKNMPQLAKMMRQGMVFDNYFVTDSLCCPSRASIFTGMLPHNTGVLTNGGPNGGFEAFTAHQDELKTFAIPLQAGGYKTSFLGKYLNGWRVGPIPPGWDDFGSTATGYDGFGYNFRHNGVVSSPTGHFTDHIEMLGRQFIEAVPSGTPFFLELAPFSPHSPYTPAVRHEMLFIDAVMPKTPEYGARPDASAPAWLQAIPPMKAALRSNMEDDYIKRVQATKSIDEMIGSIRNRLEVLGLASNTYVIFTSDNGYHMGERSLRPGKQTPFDTDVRVPFVIVGPGIAAGSRSDAITMNIDIFPTILDLAGLPPSPTVDGRSMVPLFTGAPGARNVAVIEHTLPAYDPDDPDASGPDAGDPPTYSALRFKSALYVEYATGEVSYYDMASDPYQLSNVASGLTPERLAQLHALTVANTTCAGAAQCGAAQGQ